MFLVPHMSLTSQALGRSCARHGPVWRGGLLVRRRRGQRRGRRRQRGLHQRQRLRRGRGRGRRRRHGRRGRPGSQFRHRRVQRNAAPRGARGGRPRARAQTPQKVCKPRACPPATQPLPACASVLAPCPHPATREDGFPSRCAAASVLTGAIWPGPCRQKRERQLQHSHASCEVGHDKQGMGSCHMHNGPLEQLQVLVPKYQAKSRLPLGGERRGCGPRWCGSQAGVQPQEGGAPRAAHGGAGPGAAGVGRAAAAGHQAATRRARRRVAAAPRQPLLRVLQVRRRNKGLVAAWLAHDEHDCVCLCQGSPVCTWWRAAAHGKMVNLVHEPELGAPHSAACVWNHFV